MNDIVNNRMQAMVSEMLEAERVHKESSRRLDEAKAAIKQFSDVTGVTSFDTPFAKVSVFDQQGSYLDPDKIKARFGEDAYKLCLTAKMPSKAVRLTLKK